MAPLNVNVNIVAYTTKNAISLNSTSKRGKNTKHEDLYIIKR